MNALPFFAAIPENALRRSFAAAFQGHFTSQFQEEAEFRTAFGQVRTRYAECAPGATSSADAMAFALARLAALSPAQGAYRARYLAFWAQAVQIAALMDLQALEKAHT